MSDYIAPLAGPAGPAGTGGSGTLSITAALTRSSAYVQAAGTMFDPFNVNGAVTTTASSTAGYSFAENVTVTNGRAVRASSNPAVGRLVTNAVYGDGEISATFNFASPDGDVGLFIHQQPGFNGGHMVYISAARTLVWYHLTGEGGYTATLQIPGPALAAGARNLRVVTTGAEHKIYVDGTLYYTHTDGTQPSTGRGGLFFSGPYFPTADFFSVGAIPVITVTGLPAGYVLSSGGVVSTGNTLQVLDRTLANVLTAQGAIVASAYMDVGDTWAYTAAAGAAAPAAAPVTYKSYRLRMTAGGDGNYTQVGTFGLNEVAGGPSIAAGVGSLSSSNPGTSFDNGNYGAGFDASKAFDSDVSSSWTLNRSIGATPAIIGYTFPAGHKLVEYTLAVQTATRAPTAWTFEGSDDGAAWTVLDTQFGQTFVDNMPKTFTLPVAAAPAAGGSAAGPRPILTNRTGLVAEFDLLSFLKQSFGTINGADFTAFLPLQAPLYMSKRFSARTDNFVMGTVFKMTALPVKGMLFYNGTDALPDGNGGYTMGYGIGVNNGNGGGVGNRLVVLYGQIRWIHPVSPADLLAETWYHAVLSRNAGVTTVYLNGVPVLTDSGMAPNVPSPNNSAIGAQDNAGSGAPHNVITGSCPVLNYLYEAAMSDADVLAVHNNVKAGLLAQGITLP